MIVPAILCGGSGTRLWPLSRAAKPKQFHALTSETTLLNDTIARGALVSDAAPVLIAGESMRALIAEQAPTNARVVLEPSGRNTAPAAALAAYAALETSPDAVVLMLPSDHYVGDPESFKSAMSCGARLAQDQRIVTFGITADSANTGYGYIIAGAPLGEGFDIETFEEKPKPARAEELYASGVATWNSGIYMFGARFYLDELARLQPDMAQSVGSAWNKGMRDGAFQLLERDAWEQCPSDSIDYAVAEKTRRRAVVPVAMKWNDVGSWSALHEISAATPSDNVLRGDVIAYDAKGNYARSDGRLIALVGVEDLVVIDTPEALLVMRRDRAQDVKQIVEALKAAKRDDKL